MTYCNQWQWDNANPYDAIEAQQAIEDLAKNEAIEAFENNPVALFWDSLGDVSDEEIKPIDDLVLALARGSEITEQLKQAVINALIYSYGFALNQYVERCTK